MYTAGDWIRSEMASIFRALRLCIYNFLPSLPHSYFLDLTCVPLGTTCENYRLPGAGAGVVVQRCPIGTGRLMFRPDREGEGVAWRGSPSGQNVPLRGAAGTAHESLSSVLRSHSVHAMACHTHNHASHTSGAQPCHVEGHPHHWFWTGVDGSLFTWNCTLNGKPSVPSI